MTRDTTIVLTMLLSVATACGADQRGGSASNGDVLSCPAPYVECDGNPGTICETRLDTDPANCGACGKACPPANAHEVATCTAGTCGKSCLAGYADCDHDPTNGCEEPSSTCGALAIVPSVSSPMGLGVDDAFVYYGTRGTPPDYTDGVLYKVPKSGGSPIVLAAGLNRPLNLTLDDAFVYWSNGGRGDIADGSIQFVPKAGGRPKTIGEPMLRPGNPIVVGDRLFWTVREQPLGRIVAARKDGSDATATDIVTGIANATDLEVVGDKLVWASSGLDAEGKDARVERANLDGSGRMTLATGIASPSYQLGTTADAVFVGSFTDGSVRRIPFDLGPVTIIATSIGQPMEIVADATAVYMTTASGRRVLAVPLLGGPPAVVADGETSPSYLAMDADNLYWTDGHSSGAAAIRKAKKPGK